MADIAVRRDDWLLMRRPALRRCRSTSSQRYTIPAFEIGRIRQNEFGIGDRLGVIGIRIDDRGSGNHPSLDLAGQHPHRLAVFIAEFHAMLAMYIKRVSIEYGFAFQALAMTICIMPCAAIGASQEKALSMRKGRPPRR